MSSERLWIVILALASFLAGAAGGVLLAQELGPLGGDARVSLQAEPFGPYRRRLERAFDLDERRSGYLRVALREYADQLDLLRQRSLRTLEPELVQAGEDCFTKIRDYVIPEDRRAEFDRLAGGGSGLPGSPPKQ